MGRADLYQMSNKKEEPLPGTERIRVTVPTDVARYFEGLGQRFGVSASAAAAPVLCAAARGEIRQGEFMQQPGTDTRPR